MGLAIAAALGGSIEEAYEKALASDTLSAYAELVFTHLRHFRH